MALAMTSSRVSNIIDAETEISSIAIKYGWFIELNQPIIRIIFRAASEFLPRAPFYILCIVNISSG